MTDTTTDEIRKVIVIDAPLGRVWNAISDPAEFGAWFNVDLAGAEFAPGGVVQGTMTYPGYEGLPFEMVIERVEPPLLFSYRWHPYDPDAAYDFAQEPMTLVEFHLAECADGTRLTVVESGFDELPLSRRADATRRNGEGWEMQLQNIASHVAAALR